MSVGLRDEIHKCQLSGDFLVGASFARDKGQTVASKTRSYRIDKGQTRI